MTLLAVGAAVAIAGCGQSSGDDQAAPPPSAPSSSASTDPSTTPPSSESSEPEPSSEPAPAPPPQASGDCRANELELSIGQGDAAAGTVYKQLRFTNVGDRECTVQGWPGVSYVGGDDGHQIGESAFREGEKGGAIELGKGESAFADIGMVNVGNFDQAQCEPEQVRGLRVYPPQETESMFVQLDGTGCRGDDIPGNQLTVKTIQKG
ncbi:DUF4232 domain-containing protein [Amycolatopsis antarctica]|nr:DUF4232 domain-containing protein [Amycolatopsis antarctica]